MTAGEVGDLRVTTPELSVVMSSGRVSRLLVRAPRALYFHVRDAVGSMYGSHRREWLAKTEIKVGNLARRGFFYRVDPKSKVAPPDVRPDLGAIQAAAYTTSRVARELELGGIITPKRGRMLAIPIGVSLTPTGRKRRAMATPRRFRAASPDNELVLLRVGRSLVLHQVRRRGRKRVLLPAYRLVPRVVRRPRLRFFATWAGLAQDRVSRLVRALDRTVADAEAGREPS